MRWTVIWILIIGLLVPGVSLAAETVDSGKVITVIVADPIGPGVAEFLEDAMQKATDARAACLIIQLDTPGGAVESMRKIVQAMYACQIPLVVYVSPSGARAASAGVMITMAADIAAMAPGTNIGAAHPVSGGGKELEKTMTEKVTNDLVAFTKGIAKRRGRNEEWAEKAIRESVSITSSEALELNVIDLVAKDMEELLSKIDGRDVEGKGQLKVAGADLTEITPNLRTKILKVIRATVS